MSKKTQLAFGKILSYRKYELFMERYRSAVDDFILPYLKEKSLESSAVILDVGSGDGYLKHFFDNKDLEFHGVEMQPRRIEVCEKMGYKIWNFNIEKDTFPFPDNHYDVVVASHVIEHLYNPEVAMKEIYRVLKPNGIAVIGVPMHVHWFSKIMQLRERLFPSPPLAHHQFYSMKSLKEFLKDYHIEDIRGFRLISSRKKFTWEDNIKFYKFNTWWGKRFPTFTPEINAVIRKPAQPMIDRPVNEPQALQH